MKTRIERPQQTETEQEDEILTSILKAVSAARKSVDYLAGVLGAAEDVADIHEALSDIAGSVHRLALAKDRCLYPAP